MTGNVGHGYITATDEYIDVETTLDVSLTEGTTYNVQMLGKGYICEASTKPTAGGTYWYSKKPFKYKKQADDLWVKLDPQQVCYFNISE